MTTPLNIDRMKSHDLPQVLELVKQLGYTASLDELRDRFRKIDQLSTHALFVLRSPTHVPLGFAHIHREAESLLAGDRAELHALVVDEKQRSQGDGARLLAKCEEWAKAQNVTAVRLRSNIMREAAHRFYLRHGFETQRHRSRSSRCFRNLSLWVIENAANELPRAFTELNWRR